MGSSLTVLQHNCTVLINGLDGSGKTTIVYRWKFGTFETTYPTVGFNVEEIKLSHKTIATIWDVEGNDKKRPLYRHYYENLDVIAWVVDSNDSNRFDQSSNELYSMCCDEQLVGIPILILCNKQDLPHALSPMEISERLGLSRIHGRRVRVVDVSAFSGEGLDAALKHLDDLFRKPNTDASKTSETTKASRSSLPHWPDYGLTEEDGNLTLTRFAPIKNNTECPFAKTAQLWGGKPLESESETSLDVHAKVNYAALCHFVHQCEQGKALDGFCIEIDHPLAQSAGTQEFGQCVRVVLTCLSDLDPSKEFMMRVKYIGSRGWQFRFGGMDFFVSTFAPCYPVTSSRYAFGTNRAFVLLQPNISFLRHNVHLDNVPETNWDQPKTARDKARVAYRNAGRPYHIPRSTTYPLAEHVVKPFKDDGVSVLKWWEIPSLHAQS